MNDMDWELLDRYLSGEATSGERERVEAWLAEDPEHWAQLTALRDAIAETALGESTVQNAKAEVWARLQHEIGAPETTHPPRRERRSLLARDFAPSSGPRLLTPARVAAALLLAVIGGSALGLVMLRWRAPAPAQAVRVATTGPGERATFRLADGTEVILGVASRLRYPAAFGNGSREVSLEGEAYFEVVHDHGAPFVVRAGKLVAKDLGTEFTIRAYPEDAEARVVVREGQVAIRAAGAANGPERVVAPGQLGRLGRADELSLEPADTIAYFAWTEGRLVLEDIPLKQALPELSRWFALEFRLADSTLGDVSLSATLKSQPTTDELNNLAASLGMRQRRTGGVVTLYSAQP